MVSTRQKRLRYESQKSLNLCKSPVQVTPVKQAKPQQPSTPVRGTQTRSPAANHLKRPLCHHITPNTIKIYNHFKLKSKEHYGSPSAQETKILTTYKHAERKRVSAFDTRFTPAASTADLSENTSTPPSSGSGRPRRTNLVVSYANSLERDEIPLSSVASTDSLLHKMYYYDESRLYQSDEGEKGIGMRARYFIPKGDFILEYVGDLLTLSQAEVIEAEYARFPELGSYMYFFKFKNKTWCVDATLNKWGNGRLINHSYLRPNTTTKLVEVDGAPRLYFQAIADIHPGEEILYDYGDRRKSSLASHPWLLTS